MDDFLGIPLGQLTINGLALLAIALVVFGLARGLLVPKSTHLEIVGRADKRADDYKDLWGVERRRGDVMESVSTDLVIVGENVNKLLKALPPAKGES